MADLPVPDKFPPGCEFLVTEGSPFVFIPGKGAFCAWGGTLKFDAPRMAADLLRDGIPISEEEFHRFVAASKAKS